MICHLLDSLNSIGWIRQATIWLCLLIHLFCTLSSTPKFLPNPYTPFTYLSLSSLIPNFSSNYAWTQTRCTQSVNYHVRVPCAAQ